MAYVPDEAIEAGKELSHAAFRLYACYCKYRNKETGECYPNQKTIGAHTDISRTYISEMKRELLKKGWIRVSDKGRIIPIKGFKMSDKPNFSPKAMSDKPNTMSDKPNSLPCSEPAQLTSPNNHTHTTPHARRGDGAQDRPVVCVSCFDFKTLQEYAEQLTDKGLGVKNPVGFAKSIHRSGEEDTRVQAWLDAGRTIKTRDEKQLEEWRERKRLENK